MLTPLCQSSSRRYRKGNRPEDPVLRSSLRLGKASRGRRVPAWLWGHCAAPVVIPAGRGKRGRCPQEKRVPPRKGMEQGPEGDRCPGPFVGTPTMWSCRGPSVVTSHLPGMSSLPGCTGRRLPGLLAVTSASARCFSNYDNIIRF